MEYIRLEEGGYLGKWYGRYSPNMCFVLKEPKLSLVEMDTAEGHQTARGSRGTAYIEH